VAARSGKNSVEFEATTANQPRDVNLGDFDNTFDIFSGGKAISENLQLSRLLPVGNR
jgi:hypothetical protein